MESCTYCGTMPGSQRDHGIPSSALREVRNFSVGPITPACPECNGLLSSKMFVTIPSRAAYLAERLKTRYARFLKFPVWTEDELEEMSPQMAQGIRTALAVKESVQERIANCLAVSAGNGPVAA
jgi:hypothetical protein